MPFRLIDIKHRSGLSGQNRINNQKPFCDILMYCRFTDSKLSGRLPDRRIMFYNVSCNLNRPLFNIIFQGNPRKYLFLQCMHFRFFVCLIQHAAADLLCRAGLFTSATPNKSSGKQSIGIVIHSGFPVIAKGSNSTSTSFSESNPFCRTSSFTDVPVLKDSFAILAAAA